ncbi:hypothetical protein LCGC14_2847910, partial [marine sediment metagenome]
MCDTFRANFPGVECWTKDIFGLTGKTILDAIGIERGDLDMLDGSPPCQGFSLAGKRRVMDGRNDLSMEFARLIEETMPKVFLMENVPDAPEPGVAGYLVHSVMFSDREVGGVTRRRRRFSFSSHGPT